MNLHKLLDTQVSLKDYKETLHYESICIYFVI